MQPKKQFTWKGKINLKGVRSLVGIDASVLVDLALYEESVEFFKKLGFQFPKELFCTASNCIGEAKGVLINTYKKDVAWTNKRLDEILDKFFIEKLYCKDEFYEDIDVVKKIGDKYELNEEDVPIILTLWKNGVGIVIVRDKAFEDTCKELNIDVIGFPKIETLK